MVFETIEELHHAASTTTRSTSTQTCIMVLKNCGPKGYPGMAEVGNMPLPQKLLRKGVQRHDPHLRRAHVRHGLRHRRAARRAGGRGRRAAGAGAERRPDRRSTCAARSLHLHVDDDGAGAPPRRLDAARPRARARLREALRRSRAAGRPAAPTSTSWSAAAARRCRATTTEEAPMAQPQLPLSWRVPRRAHRVRRERQRWTSKARSAAPTS